MMRRRRGYTLTECLVAITLLGTLLGTVTLTLGVMYRADRNLRDAVDQERALEQFTARFRSDAHQASSASVNEAAEANNAPARELMLKSSADQTIHYTLHPQDVERVVRRGETIVHRETYNLAVAASGWQLRDAQQPAVVSVLFERQIRIDAVVRLVAVPP
jgi:prepilin-type N-terminal cleavage/methylation domain-containing protein